MNDEQKTMEQLLAELQDLRQEVKRLRVLETQREAHPSPEDLERRVTEYMGWY